MHGRAVCLVNHANVGLGGPHLHARSKIFKKLEFMQQILTIFSARMVSRLVSLETSVKNLEPRTIFDINFKKD